MVFGNNTASDISKLSKIPRAAKKKIFEIFRAGIIAKYHVKVTLFNLFIIEAEKFSVMH